VVRVECRRKTVHVRYLISWWASSPDRPCDHGPISCARSAVASLPNQSSLHSFVTLTGVMSAHIGSRDWSRGGACNAVMHDDVILAEICALIQRNLRTGICCESQANREAPFFRANAIDPNMNSIIDRQHLPRLSRDTRRSVMRAAFHICVSKFCDCSFFLLLMLLFHVHELSVGCWVWSTRTHVTQLQLNSHCNGPQTWQTTR